MLSIKISAYKGNIPRNHVLVYILLLARQPNWFRNRLYLRGTVLTYRLVSNMTLPTGRRLNGKFLLPLPRIGQKLRRRYVARYHLPINNAMMLILPIKIRSSIESKQSIFQLAQQIIQGTSCRVSVQLCSRLSLMVSTSSSNKLRFWSRLVIALNFCWERRRW